MQNIDVPNPASLLMLGILVTVATIYTATALDRSNNKTRLLKYGIYLIVGMALGGGIGLGLALLSNLDLGEFWELGPALAGYVLGGIVASCVYARKNSSAV